MAAMVRSACAGLLALGAVALSGLPAGAQFGSIFGNPPPRPPSDVPGRPPQYPPQQYPSQQFPERDPLPGERGGFERRPVDRQQGTYQSAPLPPPPGSAPPGQGAPLDTRPQQNEAARQPGQQAPLNALPPGVRQPRGTPQPANTAPQPGDEVVPEPPTQKIVNTSAVFAGLDKITGRIISFDVAINETVQFGALQVVPRACYTRPPTETPNTDAFIEVSEVTLQGEVRRIFAGWMFAASPGLHAVEHPIYDIWLTDCKGGTPPAVASSEPAPPPAAPRPQQPRQQRAQQPRGQGGVPQLMPPPPPPQRF